MAADPAARRLFWWGKLPLSGRRCQPFFSFFFLPPNTAIGFSFKRRNPSCNLKKNTDVFTILALISFVVRKEVSCIRLEDRIIFLKSVLKLYFKHFYLRLFNSCLYKNNGCPGILKCMYYSVVRSCLVL